MKKHYYPEVSVLTVEPKILLLLRPLAKANLLLERSTSSRSPFAIAYVTLDEGPTMMTNIIECDLDALAVESTSKLKFSETEEPDGPPVPTFVLD